MHKSEIKLSLNSSLFFLFQSVWILQVSVTNDKEKKKNILLQSLEHRSSVQKNEKEKEEEEEKKYSVLCSCLAIASDCECSIGNLLKIQKVHKHYKWISLSMEANVNSIYCIVSIFCFNFIRYQEKK